MDTVTEWFRKIEGWKQEKCFDCYGTGMISDYGCGWDFYGPKNVIPAAAGGNIG